MGATFAGRVGIIQRVLSPYRIPVFDLIAEGCGAGFCIASGKPVTGETLEEGDPKALLTAVHIEIFNRHYFGGRYYLCWQSGLVQWLNSWNPDVLVVEANPRFLSTPVVINWMHKRGRPVIGHGLGIMPLSTGLESLRNWGRRTHIRQYDAVIAYSTRAAEQYSQLGFSSDHIFVAHNAIASRPTFPMPSRVEPPNETAHVLFVGRLTTGKRVDMLIDACGRMNMNSPDLWIVGEGPERSRLEELARHQGHKVRFFGDLRGQDLRSIFCKADLFVLPGLGGLAVQEAMSYGLPIIVADGDGTQFDLVCQSNGWTIQPGSIDALEVAIRDALKDRHRLRRMGQESYRMVSENINIECMAKSFLKAFNSVYSTYGCEVEYLKPRL